MVCTVGPLRLGDGLQRSSGDGIAFPSMRGPGPANRVFGLLADLVHPRPCRDGVRAVELVERFGGDLRGFYEGRIFDHRALRSTDCTTEIPLRINGPRFFQDRAGFPPLVSACAPPKHEDERRDEANELETQLLPEIAC